MPMPGEYANSTGTPEQEALALLPLLKTNSVESLRQLIGPERRDVLVAFDVLRTRWHSRRRATISAELAEEILRLLKLNYPWGGIQDTLGISSTILRRVIAALPARPSTWKIGRGRRFTAETIAAIKQAIVTEKASRKVERTFHIDWHTVNKLRHAMGDFENRRFRKKLSAEQIEQARLQVAGGRRWRDVAKDFGVAPTTLLSNIPYRKRPSFRLFSPEEEKEILSLVQRGHGKRSIAQRFGRPRSSIYWLLERTQQGRVPERIENVARAAHA